MFRIFGCLVFGLCSYCHLLGSVSASAYLTPLPQHTHPTCISPHAHLHARTEAPCVHIHAAHSPHTYINSHTQERPHTHTSHTPHSIHITRPYAHKPTSSHSHSCGVVLSEVPLCCDCVALAPSA